MQLYSQIVVCMYVCLLFEYYVEIYNFLLINYKSLEYKREVWKIPVYNAKVNLYIPCFKFLILSMSFIMSLILGWDNWS